jgi:hypothetical protein
MSALGRFLPVVTIRDFSSTTTCYPEPNGRVRPKAVIHRQSYALDLHLRELDQGKYQLAALGAAWGRNTCAALRVIGAMAGHRMR